MARKKKVTEYVIEPPVMPKYYVYYDIKTGKILSITNEIDNNYEDVIEVEHDEIAGFFTGEKKWNEYIVAQVKSADGTLTHQLVPVDAEIFDFKNSDLIHIRQHFSDDPDLLVRWNGVQNRWEFSLNKSTQSQYNYRRRMFMFFVTLEDDFDFLIRRIEIEGNALYEANLITVPFESKYEHNKTKISISTVDLFKTYNLEVYE